MLLWFRKDIGIWLYKIFESSLGHLEGQHSNTVAEAGGDQAIAIMRPAISRFEYHIYKSMSELRISELFDIIVEFPDSLPALEDLRLCLSKTDQRSLLVRTLQKSNRTRLLHPGADTQDIITQYISLMKAMRVLDPPGVLLSCVGHPVRTYLRSREDTIRCIVTSLVEPGHTLGDELDRSPCKDRPISGPDGPSFSIKEEVDYTSPNWTPDPVDAPIGYKNGLKEDAIESLVSIYETRDGFVKELQLLLSSRLLNVKGFDVSMELARVEILKSKFGEVRLQPCDIMLKDLADSKRVDTSVHELIAGVESHFANDLSVTGLLECPTFARYSISIRTTIASVIELFEEKETWTIGGLAERLNLTNDLSLVRNGLYFWSNHEVLKEIESGIWRLFENVESFNASAAGTSRHVIEEPSKPADNSQSKIEKMRVFSAFIVGMLTNLGGLPLERIFVTLNTVMPTFKGTTRDELSSLLEMMQREGTVIPMGDLWKIVK
ncbi:uncharacterized protein MELLADRAFT_95091 [Melampsora larici-populina 98AG31]|uniref:Anaphase-promoting complex subunit 2 C-terminal domain-containing protein n=1 Tax=Melampsora larici-populina (strain 98AG31 / pathotype 3-4-7) TaxID=747676 RepID=F4S940_MELLP|nr:uncharacterized protein MELLADRAFT_95091 [Melampsora larici-populina 98AG31]EGF98847.1 hypothetical protein MELLADRAFT_95091 [Melampsora larici-populina 98AG31]